MNLLDKTGLTHFWEKIKENFYNKEEINTKLNDKGTGLLTNSIIGWEEEEIPEGYEELPESEPQVPIGSGMDYYGVSAPDKWLFADGSEISRTEYNDLFLVIGTRYGEGDGSTTFNLPDKRERVSISAGGEDWYPGKTGGSLQHNHTQAGWTGDVWLSEAQMPKHNHAVTSRVNSDGTNNGGSFMIASFGSPTSGNAAYNLAIGSPGIVASIPTGAAVGTLNKGGNQPHAHTLGSTNLSYSLPPYLVCNYIIKVKK